MKHKSFIEYVKGLHAKLLPEDHNKYIDHVVQAVIDKCVEEGIRKAVIAKRIHALQPSIGDAVSLLAGTTVGGIGLRRLAIGEEEEVEREVRHLLDEVKKRAESTNIQPYATTLEPTPAHLWQNWNKNQSVAVEKHHPKNLQELQHLISQSSQRKTRAVGFGHSWAPIVLTKEDGGVVPPLLINTNNPHLKNILSTSDQVRKTNTVTFECGVSVKELEDWLQEHAPTHTVGSNVVLTEVHMVGLTACVCHGTGYEWASVSDMIRAVSVIDVHGKLTTYSDLPREKLSIPDGELLEHLVVDADELRYQKAAMGLLGVVYAITLDLVYETKCRYKCQGACQAPLKHPVPALQVTDRTIRAHHLRDPHWYQENVGDHGWVEIFWVPGAEKAWVKSWVRAAPGVTPQFYDTQAIDFLSTVVSTRVYKMRRAYLELGLPQSKRLNKLFMRSISDIMLLGKEENPTNPPVYKWYDSIHFRNNITEIPVEDTEFAFPVGHNYETAAKAFRELQDRIDFYAKDGIYPADIVCEMRFTAGSKATLAHYPASISNKWVHMEFLAFSVEGYKNLQAIWEQFMVDIAERWMKLGPDVFPHWAKGWQKIPGIEERLRAIPGMKDFVKKMKEEDPAGKFLPHNLEKLFKGV